MTKEELDRIKRAEEIQLYTENRCEALENENHLVKSLLYCTKGTCDNCGLVNCENFQMQRKSEPCALYVSYKDRIKQLEQENAELKAKYDTRLRENTGLKIHNAYVEKKLTEAKTHIHRLLVLLTEGNRSYAVIDEARAFMKE